VATGIAGSEKLYSLLMLTARGRPEDVLKGFEAGADDYLPKPLTGDSDCARGESAAPQKLGAQREPCDGGRIAARSESPDIFRFDDKEVTFATCNCAPGKDPCN